MIHKQVLKRFFPNDSPPTHTFSIILKKIKTKKKVNSGQEINKDHRGG